MLAPLAVLTLVVGNVVAIVQTNLKRMLAYSTIANVGIHRARLRRRDPGRLHARRCTTHWRTCSWWRSAPSASILLVSRKGFEADRLDHFKGL